MSEERLQEIKDSVDFQREILLAQNLGTLCVDEEQELIDEIERLNNDIKALFKENSNKEKVIKAQDNIIKEVRELLSQELYTVLRKGTIKQVLEILDKVGDEK